MATMIPEDTEEFETVGEGVFYKFLKAVAKPDGRYLCWYTPDIKGKEPDFLFFCEDVGLLIFEVKDWALNQIAGGDSHSFFFRNKGREESRKNPFRQARACVGSVKDKIREDGSLVSKEPQYLGNPKVPISCGVVFPNINRSEYIQKGLDEVISSDKIFFWDDLHPTSDLCNDPSGQCFLNVLKKKFPLVFPFKITGKELDRLRYLIFPTVKIELPKREPGETCREESERLKVLDQHQEAIARKFDGGHRIIVGPSGSGKTLILVHKAAFLKQYNAVIKNILFVCYNVTLVNYIKRLLSDKGIALGEGGVEVYHFYQLCSKILGQEIAYEKEESEYYNLVVLETLSKIQNLNLKYDAILVDEGQDFSDDMLKVITSLLNPKTNNLTVALDEHQSIYRQNQSWKDLGIEAEGRVHRISHAYRSTREISHFASTFAGVEEGKSEVEASDPGGLFPDVYGFNGPKPEMKQRKSVQDLVTYVSDRIKVLVDSGECSCSEIAIIYTIKTPSPVPDKNIPQMFATALESKGILTKWTSEDYRAKKSYDLTTNSVTISTIHSVKGLDYSCVFLVGLDFYWPRLLVDEKVNLSTPQPEGRNLPFDKLKAPGAAEGIEVHPEPRSFTSPSKAGFHVAEWVKNLVYVGMTRARYRLFIPYVDRNELIDRLLGCL
jgi:hypothetical protein